MNRAELIADLQTKCVWVGTPQKKPNSANAPLPEQWIVQVLEYQPNSDTLFKGLSGVEFNLLNPGVVAGPQVDESGNPVLDGEGNQIVIAPEDAETVLVQRKAESSPVLLPQVRTFLDTLVPTPYIRCEVESIDEESMYAFVKAWKVIDGTTAQEVRLILWKNEGQPPAYRELV